MQSVELKGLKEIDRLCKRLERSPEVFQQARRACFEEAAREAPKKESWTERTKKAGNRYAAGAVTNAIVSGHRFPSPSGRKYYKPRIRSGGMKVPGRPFYDQAGPQIRDLARRTAERVAKQYLKELEG